MPANAPQPGGRRPLATIPRILGVLYNYLPASPPSAGVFIVLSPFIISWSITFVLGAITFGFTWFILVTIAASLPFESPRGKDEKQRSPEALLPPKSSARARARAREKQRTFHRFPLLPIELRFEIWSLACAPRLVQLQLPGKWPAGHGAIGSSLERISWHYTSSLNPDTPYSGPTRVLISSTPPPALLAVNSEARRFALQRYELGFATTLDPRASVYVDFERDLVSLSDEILNSLSGRMYSEATPDLAKVQWLHLPKSRLNPRNETPGDCFGQGVEWQRVYDGVKAVCVVKSAVSPPLRSPPKTLLVALWMAPTKGEVVWWYKGEEEMTWIKTDPWGMAENTVEIYKYMD